MTQIDFYILGEDSHRNINQMVCRLCEKALAQEMNVLVYTESAEQAQQLDDLLWTFKADSFIAHKNQLNEPSAAPENSFNYPVLITAPEQTDNSLPTGDKRYEQYTRLLINLTAEMPPFHQQFERIAEMVDKDVHAKEIARNHYRFYREKGYSLNKYEL